MFSVSFWPAQHCAAAVAMTEDEDTLGLPPSMPASPQRAVMDSLCSRRCFHAHMLSRRTRAHLFPQKKTIAQHLWVYLGGLYLRDDNSANLNITGLI